MPWETSRRRDGLPKDWPKIRIVRLRLDSPTGSSKDAVCQHIRYDTGKKCGLPANQVDHKDNSRRDDHSMSNLQSLCEWHHNQKSASEGHAAQAAKKQANKPVKRHPGLLHGD